MHQLQFILENENHKILLNFETQTNHLILDQTTRPSINKKKKKKEKEKKSPQNKFAALQILPFQRTALTENERKRKDKVLRSCQRAEKPVACKSDGGSNNSWRTQNRPQRVEKLSEEELRPYAMGYWLEY